MITSKEDERKALEKIRKIVADLGEGSYLSYAFDGCFELAESNIENDFAISMKDSIDTYEALSEDLSKRVSKLTTKIENLEEANRTLDKRYEESLDHYSTLHKQCDDYYNLWQESKEQVKELEYQVIVLKAKLYDYMVEKEGNYEKGKN